MCHFIYLFLDFLAFLVTVLQLITHAYLTNTRIHWINASAEVKLTSSNDGLPASLLSLTFWTQSQYDTVPFCFTRYGQHQLPGQSNVFANHWYVHICTCHRLRTIDIVVSLSHRALMTRVRLDCRGDWWWSYGREARDNSSRLHSTFLSVKPLDIFRETSELSLCRPRQVF